jgi:REP element-mobilizing transposase RayT
MPQSFSAVYVHLIFSTKDREPFLTDKPLRTSLHSQLGGISKKLQSPTLIVGGVEDHVHLLARLSRTIAIADWVKELKRVSNGWLKEQGQIKKFRWQAGYGAFSVSKSNLDSVKDYVLNQETHHRKMTFQDELRSILRKHDIEWDERYVWD